MTKRKYNRRDFIRITGIGAGSLIAAGGSFRLIRGESIFGPATPAGELRRFPTYCEVCFWKCAGWAYTDKQGKIVKILGNEDDPQCGGRLCPRGTGGVGMYHDPDRLTKPLIRTGKPGSQSFREATWEEALELVASKMKEIAAKDGPESIALFNHGSAGHHFGHLLKAFGSGNIAAPSYAQCRGPREAAFLATFGAEVGSPEPTDIRDTRCLVLIGSHIGENMHNGQVQEMSEAIDKGAVIITVDPRFSTAASKSKYWLPIRPATDLALLLAWINVIIDEGIYDKDYVAKYTSGFEELKQHVRPMTPEWAYGITTIKPHLIRETAREMANASPAVIVHPGRHVTWYGDDTQRLRAVAILNALLGSWGRRGGFYFKESIEVPELPHPEYPKPRWSWRDTLGERFPLANTAVTNTFIDASLPSGGREPKLRAWLVAGTNLPVAMPQKADLEEAMQALKLLVVIDTMPMEITGYADVILPECTYLERYDELRDSSSREPTVALRMPAAEPKGDSKPAWWIARELGMKLGLEKFFPYKDYKEVLEWQLQEMGTSLTELQRRGVINFPRQSRPIYLEENEEYTFNTNSGKIELYSSDLAAAGFDPIPVYVPHPQPPEGYFRMIYGRAPMHTFSRTANNPNLTDLMKENSVWVNPRVAEEWGFKKDQYVWLKNQDGVVSAFPVKVRITERIRWDSVYMVHGFGHKDKKLSRAYGKGANDTEMITNIMVDPIMGGTGMRGNFVTFLPDNPGKEEEQ
jgi:thiosulfate reductase/polysulfide reductase chain A